MGAIATPAEIAPVMTAEQTDELRQKLQAEKQKLAKELSSLDAAVNERPDCSVTDGADAAALQERRHRAASLHAHHQRTVAEIDAALLRMDTGRYGISETTGEEIPFERLRLVPWARTE